MKRKSWTSGKGCVGYRFVFFSAGPTDWLYKVLYFKLNFDFYNINNSSYVRVVYRARRVVSSIPRDRPKTIKRAISRI